MRDAKIAQEGSPRELYEVPNDSFVADFIGEANLVPCEVVKIKNDIATSAIGDYQFKAPARGLNVGPATLAIRPNRIVISRKVKKNEILAEIKKATYIGSHMEYTVDTENGAFFVKSGDVTNPHHAGDHVSLSFAENGPVLMPQ